MIKTTEKTPPSNPSRISCRPSCGIVIYALTVAAGIAALFFGDRMGEKRGFIKGDRVGHERGLAKGVEFGRKIERAHSNVDPQEVIMKIRLELALMFHELRDSETTKERLAEINETSAAIVFACDYLMHNWHKIDPSYIDDVKMRNTYFDQLEKLKPVSTHVNNEKRNGYQQGSDPVTNGIIDLGQHAENINELSTPLLQKKLDEDARNRLSAA